MLGTIAAERELEVLDALYDHKFLSFYRIRLATGIYPAKLGITIEDLVEQGCIESPSEVRMDMLQADYQITNKGKRIVKESRRETKSNRRGRYRAGTPKKR